MAVDEDYIERFEKEVKLLTKLQEEVKEALSRANKRLDDMRKEVKK